MPFKPCILFFFSAVAFIHQLRKLLQLLLLDKNESCAENSESCSGKRNKSRKKVSGVKTNRMCVPTYVSRPSVALVYQSQIISDTRK